MQKGNRSPISTDSGCQYAAEYLGKKASCLDCPFPECVFDNPEDLGYLKERKRSEEIFRQFEQGKTHKELASLFGVSIGTVYNVLKRHSNNGG